MVDKTCKQLGIDDIEAVAALIAGYPFLKTRAKPRGTVKGTSLASVTARRFLNYDVKKRILPTIVGRTPFTMRILLVNNIGKFVGRTVPVLGWLILAHDVLAISVNTVASYNALVKPEDKFL